MTLCSLEKCTDENMFKQGPYINSKVASYESGEETVHSIARQSIVGSTTLSSERDFNLTITVVLLDPGRASL